VKIAVLLIDSPERDVSAKSAKAVADAARTAGFDVSEIDLKSGPSALDEISKDSVVLPISHGVNAEDGWVQAELEKRGLPFLGSNSHSSKNCFDKWTARTILSGAGIVMPKAVRVTKETFKNDELSRKPFVLKILNGGSSIGTLIARDPLKVKQSEIDAIFEMENEAVLEQLIEGSEITVPVLDKKALPVIEIIPPPNAEFDYDNKYNGATQELLPPKNVSIEIQKESQIIAERVHQIMGCRHLSRTDFMVDRNGDLFVLEINTMPGMTDQSLYPKSAAVAGLPMPQLVKKFVELVKRDFKLGDE
jgi:D-alanine-D-alanine ligase